MNQPDPAQVRSIRRIVWFALLVSQVVYVLVLLIGLRPGGDAPSSAAFLPGIFGVVAAMNAAGAHLFWRRASGAGLALHSDRRDPEASFPQYLIAWVLDESIGIFGLVLGLLGFAPAVWAGFNAAGLLLLLLHGPRSD